MKETIDFIKVDIASFQDMCKRIQELEAENKELREENTRFKAKNLALTKRLQNVTLWDLSPEAQEEAGHAFARSLGIGVKMTPEEVAVEAAENGYKPYTAEDY